jgi:hypothetical protein
MWGMTHVVICDMCGRRAAPHGHYVVKMEVYADPSLPAVTSDELEEKELAEGMKELMEQMTGMTAEDLEDQVHRRFEFKACGACQPKLLANPLGLPRDLKTGAN